MPWSSVCSNTIPGWVLPAYRQGLIVQLQAMKQDLDIDQLDRMVESCQRVFVLLAKTVSGYWSIRPNGQQLPADIVLLAKTVSGY